MKNKSIHSTEYAVVLRMLRKDRKESGVTQVELARKLGLTQSQISKIERGENRLDILQLRSFCQAVGVSVTDFVRRLEAELTASK